MSDIKVIYKDDVICELREGFPVPRVGEFISIRGGQDVNYAAIAYVVSEVWHVARTTIGRESAFYHIEIVVNKKKGKS